MINFNMYKPMISQYISLFGSSRHAEVSRDNTATKPAQRAHDSSIPDNQLSIEAVREEERKRIARDLHDDLGQLLSTMRLRLYGCKAASKDDNAPLEAQLSAISALLDQAQHATKNIVRDLRPPVMQAAEFTSTVQDRITTFTEQSGLDCQLRTHQFNHLVLSEAQVSGLLSIIQESLTNIIKHADSASKVTIALDANGAQITLKVKDNGRGLNLNQSQLGSQSFGLLGLQERAKLLGGRFNIRKRILGGTEVVAQIPKTH